MSAVCVTPGCTCPTSRRQEREAAAAAVAEAQLVEAPVVAEPEIVAPAAAEPRRQGRPLSPCGTIAAYRRHVKKGEPIDGACDAAHKLFEASRRQERTRAEQDEREAESTAKAAAAVGDVVFVGGRVLFELSVEDARMVAAAVLDRALSLEANRHTASSGKPPTEQTAKVEALRLLSKRISQAVRSVA